MNLIETYAKKLDVSEAVYGRDHDSKTLNASQKTYDC